MIRAFIAIDVSEETVGHLKEVQEQLGRMKLVGRPVKLDSVHLTLKFLGNIEDHLVAPIEEAMQKSAIGLGPFCLEVQRVGVFPHLSHPRVVWAGVTRDPTLVELQDRLEELLQELDFPREKRSFHPHLTLLRLKSPKNVANLVRFIAEKGSQFRFGSFPVSDFHLYRSILGSEGSRYVRLKSVGLKKE